MATSAVAPCAAAVRAAYDPAQAPRFRAGHPGAADDHPELPAVGTFRAGPAAEHRFGGTFTKRAAAHPAESEPERFTNPQFAAKPKRPAKPERVVNVAIPEPENTGSDRLRNPAPISQDVRSLTATPGACMTLLGTGSNGPLAASESERPREVITQRSVQHLSVPQRPKLPIACSQRVTHPPDRLPVGGYQGWHESTLLSRQPWRGQECKELCTSLWMNCANAQDGGAMPGDMPGEPLAAPPATYQRKCR